MTTFTMDTTDEIEAARAVGIGDPKFYSRVFYGGGAATGLIHQAVMAVATGMAETVVCYRSLNGRSAPLPSGVSGDISILTPSTGDGEDAPWIIDPASWVAMFTQRYMHLTNCTKDPV